MRTVLQHVFICGAELLDIAAFTCNPSHVGVKLAHVRICGRARPLGVYADANFTINDFLGKRETNKSCRFRLLVQLGRDRRTEPKSPSSVLLYNSLRSRNIPYRRGISHQLSTQCGVWGSLPGTGTIASKRARTRQSARKKDLEGVRAS
jgi:hypothetical protein